MNVEILSYPENIENEIVKDSKLYYDNLEIKKQDLERFCRKCIRDENFTLFYKYIISLKIESTLSIYNELLFLNFNLSKAKIDFNSLEFMLPNQLQKNEKIQNIVVTYLKKIILSIEELSKENDFDIQSLLPSICNVHYIKNSNLISIMNLCALKEYNNCSHELVLLGDKVFEECNKKIPFLFNSVTYKLFLKHKKNSKLF